jgi:hypothetical protein
VPDRDPLSKAMRQVAWVRLVTAATYLVAIVVVVLFLRLS